MVGVTLLVSMDEVEDVLEAVGYVKTYLANLKKNFPEYGIDVINIGTVEEVYDAD